MNEYDFRIRFRFADPHADPEQYLGALADAGLDDATVGVGKKGFISLTCTRRATSARAAVSSAIRNARSAIPGIRLVETIVDAHAQS